MMSAAPFECVQPRRVLVGAGRLEEAGAVVQGYGRRCLVFTGSRVERAARVLEVLGESGIAHEVVCVSGEPTFESVRQAQEAARVFAPDVVLAYGGGSVMDTAKAVAMLLPNGGDPLDYAEIVGEGRPVTCASLPLVAVPTTAGTGTEATRNAVVKHVGRQVKVSLRSRTMLPEVVILDRSSLDGLPRDLIAATGMDALCQLIEAFVCCRANSWTDALCREGIPMVARSLPVLCACPEDGQARERMQLAACWSGVALANAGLGAVHGFAAVLGGVTAIAHGVICAKLLAPVCRANIGALVREGSSPEALRKYRELACMLAGRDSAKPMDGVVWLEALTATLPLGTCSLSVAVEADRIVSGAKRASSMKGNPVVLSDEALLGILNSLTP